MNPGDKVWFANEDGDVNCYTVAWIYASGQVVLTPAVNGDAWRRFNITVSPDVCFASPNEAIIYMENRTIDLLKQELERSKRVLAQLQKEKSRGLQD